MYIFVFFLGGHYQVNISEDKMSMRLTFLGFVIQINTFLHVCLQVFNYLVACDHLCQLGYHVAQVEEALEMFQNCETKVRATLYTSKGTKTFLVHCLDNDNN